MKRTLLLCFLGACAFLGGAVGSLLPSRLAGPALVEALKDGDVTIRLKAAELLQQLDPDNTAAFPVLVESLKHPDRRVRQHAAETLGRIGPRARVAVPGLCELLTDSDERLSAATAEALGRIAADPRTAVPALGEWLVRAAPEHAGSRLSVEGLASRMAMSVRHFERVFTREVGTTPSQYVLQVRVETARRLLERTDGGLKSVAATAGFGSVDVMRRAFVRLLGVTPRRYREMLKAES